MTHAQAPASVRFERIFAIGGSAGALTPLRAILAALPADFPAPICVVLHVSPESPGVLPDILTRAGALTCRHAQGGETLLPGRVYLAPPGKHMILDTENRIVFGDGPKENRFRPAVDPLLRSAALHYGPAAVGIILSGGLDDGAAGLAAIKAVGGVTIVQAPEEALMTGMIEAALATASVDHAEPAQGIAGLMQKLALERVPVSDTWRSNGATQRLEIDMAVARGDPDATRISSQLGWLSPIICPDCDGVLRIVGERPVRYRCHTGHAYTANTLADLQRQRIEDSLYAALQRVRERQYALSALMPKSGFEGDAGDTRSNKAQFAELESLANELQTLIHSATAIASE